MKFSRDFRWLVLITAGFCLAFFIYQIILPLLYDEIIAYQAGYMSNKARQIDLEKRLSETQVLYKRASEKISELHQQIADLEHRNEELRNLVVEESQKIPVQIATQDAPQLIDNLSKRSSIKTAPSTRWRGYTGDKEFDLAIRTFDYMKVKGFIKRGLDTQTLTKGLHYAVSMSTLNGEPVEGRIEIIKMLLNAGADINAFHAGTFSGDPEVTVLYEAVGNVDYQLTRFLISRGADIRKAADFNHSPLHRALASDFTGSEEDIKKRREAQLKIIGLLLDKGDFKIDSTILTIPVIQLTDPAENGKLKLLMQKGLTLDAVITPDRNGNVPWFIALERGHIKTVEVFLSMGADPAMEDANGRNALTLAISKNKTDMTQYLLNLKYVFTQDQLNAAIEQAMGMGQKQVVDLLEAKGGIPGPAYKCPDCVYQSQGFPGEGVPVFAAAQKEIELYAEPLLSAEKSIVLFHIDERLEYEQSVYRTVKSVTLTAKQSTADISCQVDSVNIAPGDTLEYLQYRAEGYGLVRVKNKICEIMLDDRVLSGLDKAPETEWWIKVIKNDKPLGWLLVDHANAQIKFLDRMF